MEFPQITATEPDHGGSPPENIGTNPGAEAIQPDRASLGSLDHPTPVDPVSFPHQPRGAGSQLPATIANVKHLLTSYGVSMAFVLVLLITTRTLIVSRPSRLASPLNARSKKVGNPFLSSVFSPARAR